MGLFKKCLATSSKDKIIVGLLPIDNKLNVFKFTATLFITKDEINEIGLT